MELFSLTIIWGVLKQRLVCEICFCELVAWKSLRLTFRSLEYLVRTAKVPNV